MKIRQVCNEFAQLLRTKGNQLEEFNALIYYYRVNTNEEINDDASDFCNILLKKIIAINVVVFVEYFDQKLALDFKNEIDSLRLFIPSLPTDVRIKDKVTMASLIKSKTMCKTAGSFKVLKRINRKQKN